MANFRTFTPFEDKNIEYLVNLSIPFTYLQLTRTGKGKYCPDATRQMRNYFLNQGIHDYEKQQNGIAFKVTKVTHILTSDYKDIKTTTSFYRANTRGDRRFNITGLNLISEDDDIHVIFNYGQILCVMDISKVNIESCMASPLYNPVKHYLSLVCNVSNSIAYELLGKLRDLSHTWHRTVCSGDTAVGRTTEFLLGLPYNPKPVPDYKGIELKSKREYSKSKSTMFGAFPDWANSKCNRATLLEKYGAMYHDGIRKVFQTVATYKPNNKDFFLRIDDGIQRLKLKHDSQLLEDIVTWQLEGIHQKLLKKHKETFWIGVYSQSEGGNEYMMFKDVLHTKNPLTTNFDNLIRRSIISMDIAVGRQKTKPDGSKSGDDNWNFRMSKDYIPQLFPEMVEYSLENW